MRINAIAGDNNEPWLTARDIVAEQGFIAEFLVIPGGEHRPKIQAQRHLERTPSGGVGSHRGRVIKELPELVES